MTRPARTTLSCAGAPPNTPPVRTMASFAPATLTRLVAYANSRMMMMIGSRTAITPLPRKLNRSVIGSPALRCRLPLPAAPCASSRTITAVPATPMIVTVRPAGTSASAVAPNSWVWPSAFTSTLPNRLAGIATLT